MCRTLLILLIVTICSLTQARAQQVPQIGLYVDDIHGEHCAYGSDYQAVDVYAFGKPGENGIQSIVLQVLYPDNVLIASTVYNDNYSGNLGDPASGVMVSFFDCQDDWVWAFRQTVLIVNEDVGLIQAYPPSPPFDSFHRGKIGIFDCGESGEQLYLAAERISNVCINFCSDDLEPPLIEEVRIVDYNTLEAVFTEEITSETAENIDNYVVFNRLSWDDSIQVTSAVLLGDGITVEVGLAEPFSDNTPYLLEAGHVADATGNTWETWGQFGSGPDLVVRNLVFPDTLASCAGVMTVTCTVVNIGEYPVLNSLTYLDYLVEEESVYPDVRNLGAEYTGELAPGDSIALVFTRDVGLDQNYSFHPQGILKVTADRNSGIHEAREDNNELIAPLVTLTARREGLESFGDGTLRLDFHRALYDSPDFLEPVSSYAILRRIGLQDTYETVASIGADGSDLYTIDFPSYPGEEYTWFFIRAVRPADGTEYNYDNCALATRTGPNVAPSQPTGFTARQVGDVIRLEWDPNEEPDLGGYRVWWSDTGEWPPFTEDPYEPCHMPIGYPVSARATSFDYRIDYYGLGLELYFRVYAYDYACNFSEFAIIVPDQVVSTQLQSFAGCVKGDRIEVSWSIMVSQEIPQFSVFRSETERNGFVWLKRTVEHTGDGDYRYIDTDVMPGEDYIYRIEVADGDGSRILFETEPISMPALGLTLHQNHPNPFNPTTTINFYLPERCPVRLEIFDVSGRRVACLIDDSMDKGPYAAEWNGKDQNGAAAASGVYFYRLTAGKKMTAKKMVLLR